LGVLRLSSGRNALWRELEPILPRFRFGLVLEISHCFVCIDLFVAKRDQCEQGLVRLLLLRRRAHALHWLLPRLPLLQLVLQFKTNSLSRFFSEPLIFEIAATSEFTTAAFKIIHAHSTKHCERQFRSDPAYVVYE